MAADGRPYAAADPHLLTWVHIAEADSFLRAHTRFGAEPLDQAGRDGYVADVARIGAALGVPDPPLTERDLTERIEAYRGELASTPEARAAARFLLLNPPLPGPGAVRVAGRGRGVAVARVGPVAAAAAVAAGGGGSPGPPGWAGGGGRDPVGHVGAPRGRGGLAARGRDDGRPEDGWLEDGWLEDAGWMRAGGRLSGEWLGYSCTQV